MAFIKVEKCAIRGISGCVPSQVEENIDLPFYSSKEEAEQVIAATGIERRHVSPKDITASDLCLKAAEKLIQELGWEKDSIDLLAFCTGVFSRRDCGNSKAWKYQVLCWISFGFLHFFSRVFLCF